MNESFCELVKCRFHTNKEFDCRLTPDFKCRNSLGEFDCMYLTCKVKIRNLNKLVRHEIEIEEEYDEIEEYIEEVDYRNPLIIIAALVKCGYLNESKVKQLRTLL